MGAKAKSYDFLSTVRSPARGGATTRVIEALREAIVSLELQPGAALDKQMLCDRLGVSRFPVSEALSRLQSEGLVEIQPQRGTTVTLIRLADARENMFLRRSLEAAVLKELAPAVTADVLEALRRNLRYQRTAVEADDRPGFHKLDLEFHDILLNALGFPRLKAGVESARLGLERARRLLASPRRHAVTLEEHEAILAALETRDAGAAAAAMERHLDAVMAELLAHARKQPDIFADGQAPAGRGA